MMMQPPHDNPPTPAPRSNTDEPAPARPLHVGEVSSEALNLNVEGRDVHPPLAGFGQLWQKTYQLRFNSTQPTPEQAMREWKAHLSEFWPPGNELYTPLTGITPGEVAVVNLGVPGQVALSTGMLITQADERSFTMLTPEGHILAGRIIFSAFAEVGRTTLQIDILMRAGDPLYELMLLLGGQRQEDRFWAYTLHQLAQHFGSRGRLRGRRTRLDRRRQWRYAGNIWRNAAIRTGLHRLTEPVRRMARPGRRTDDSGQEQLVG